MMKRARGSAEPAPSSLIGCLDAPPRDLAIRLDALDLAGSVLVAHLQHQTIAAEQARARLAPGAHLAREPALPRVVRRLRIVVPRPLAQIRRQPLELAPALGHGPRHLP